MYTTGKIATIAVLAMAINTAMAADSVDVKVVGTIVPAACTPAVTGGATFDYGTIPASTIPADDYTVLGVKTLDFSITCDASAKVALRGVDGKSNTAAKPIGKSFNDPDNTLIDARSWMFGLGAEEPGKLTGSYRMWIETPTVKLDGKAAGQALISSNLTSASPTWAASPNQTVLITSPNNRYYAWSTDATTAPASFTTMTGTLSVQAAINKGSALDLTKAVHLDGVATIELYYL